MKPRLLDLFCGAGGAARGYQEAGFYVVGVDIEDQPNYAGDEFIQADALEWLRGRLDGPRPNQWFTLGDYAAIHASPPCQAYTVARNVHQREYPDLIGPARELLHATGLPYVIENVPGAPLDSPITLCGLSFGLGVKRHRLFECNFPVMAMPCGDHSGDWVTVFGHTVLGRRPVGNGPRAKRQHQGVERGREAMGIDWMTRGELSEAIPPAYTEHVASYLLTHLQTVQKAAA